MKNYPQQPEYIEKDRQALAPYNFVPLPDRIIRLTPEKILPDQDQYHADRLSGYLDCELTTASPLYTRAALTPEDYAAGAKAKDESAFFYVTDKNKPVIPGSSLRGLLRSLVEIVTYSKVSMVSDKKLVYRAVGGQSSHAEGYRERLMRLDKRVNNKMHFTPLIYGGYMVDVNGEWKIKPAKKIEGTTFAYLEIDDSFFSTLNAVPGCRNAYEVYIKTDPYDYQPVRHIFVKYVPVVEKSASSLKGLRRGTLARSGPMNKKKYEAVIYEPDNKAGLLDLDDDLIEDYRNQITPGQKKILQDTKEKQDNGVLREGQPVFYLLNDDGSVFFFGHSRMLRFTYPNSPLDYVPEELRREQDIDFAEAIFGYTKQSKDGKSQSYAGRVFISDAKLKPGQADLWLEKGKDRVVVPKILASPKPTTFQHYLVQETPNNERIGTTRDGRPRYTVYLKDYTDSTPSDTVIRGHKLYWHKGNASLSQIKETDPVPGDDKQHTRMQPLSSGIRFKFRIDFENLCLEELGALLWVLEKASNDNFRLKLGMGKPLGMGAVKIAYTLHKTKREARYSKLFSKKGWWQGSLKAGVVPQKAVQAFNQFVLEHLDRDPKGDLEGLPRIQALLTLLSWPGPENPDKETRYLEIQQKEYRDRPVLPTPGYVLRESSANQANGFFVPAPEEKMTRQGSVISFELGKHRSYGYIRVEGVSDDVFVHKNYLAAGLKTLRVGQQVVFSLIRKDDGWEAHDVMLAE